VLVDRDEPTDHTVVELERTLELGQGGRVTLKLRDDVIARLLRADLVRKLATAPKVQGNLTRRSEERVVLGHLFVDGGVFE